MNLNYPVGDFLIRLKNAGIAGRDTVIVKNSKLIKAVAETLNKLGYLDQVSEKDGNLTVKMSVRKKVVLLSDVKLISKPGLRIYMGAEEIAAKRGPSNMIISTPLGVMSGKDAIKKKVGGEIIAEVF